MAFSAKNKPLKKRHVEFQPGTPKVLPTIQPADDSFFVDVGSNLEPVAGLEPLDFAVREEEAAVLLGDISTSCLPEPVDVSAKDSSTLLNELLDSSSLANAPVIAENPHSRPANRPNFIRQCIGCSFLANSSADLKEHYQICSSEVFGSSENLCNSSQLNMSHRKRKKSPKGLFECQFCNFYTRQLQAFKTHLRSHKSNKTSSTVIASALKKQKCPKCKVMVFNLRNHAIKQHARADGTLKQFVCMLCPYLANSPAQLKAHLQAKHLKGSKKYKCNMCDKEYAYLPSLYRHQLHHAADKDRLYPRICSTCNARFRSRTALDAHVVSRHTKERAFACEICSKCFATAALLKQHKLFHDVDSNGTPSRQSVFKCDHCNHEFKRTADLKKHVTSVHKGEKPHQCRMGCDRKFSDQSSRKRHERTHTGEKPYACNHCPMRFSQTNGLQSHMKAKHNQLNSQPKRLSLSDTAVSSSFAQQPTQCAFVSSASTFDVLPDLGGSRGVRQPYSCAFAEEAEKLSASAPTSEVDLWSNNLVTSYSMMSDQSAAMASSTADPQFYPYVAPVVQPDSSSRSLQALACDPGVLNVLNELVATGRLEQCAYCAFLASSADALAQHIRQQHTGSQELRHL